MSSAVLRDFEFDVSTPSSDIAGAYATYGVVIVKNCLPQELVRPVQELLRVTLVDVENLARDLGIARPLAESGPAIAKLFNESMSLSKDQRHLLLGHFPLQVRLSEPLKQLPIALRRLAFVRELMGSQTLFAHLPINARYILPNQTYSAVPTHQDTSYNRHMKQFCIIWTPFCEIDAECCGMAVYPKTHVLGELAPIAADRPATHEGWIPPIDMGDAKAIPVEPLSPGDIIIFSDTLVHESVPNRSNRIRLNAEMRLFGSSQHTTKHCMDLQSGRVLEPA
ncbi:MAG TPA: phytanoyl-CoA dioxygenase family protein [Pseudolabrys sp.]|nr:phytanoyl-CoA dioxygenase family protein [Pseudolabrys sp.]